MTENDWKPIETLPASRIGDLIELQTYGGGVVLGWMITSLRCAPRVFFMRNDEGEIRYVKPAYWRDASHLSLQGERDHNTVSLPTYIPCVY